MTTTNQDIVGDKCVRNDRGDLATSDLGKHLAWKEHYQRLLNEEFEWNKEDLGVSNPIIGPHPQIDEESVRKAFHKMKKVKASRTFGTVLEILLTSGDVGIELITNLFNKIIAENKVPEDWDTSVTVKCFKNKGDVTEQGNKMKVFERISKQKIRELVDTDAMQFGFMPRKSTINAIFTACQLQERYLEKKKKLFFAFVDVENTFDRVPREVVKWAMRKLGVDEWLIRAVMIMCRNSNSVIRVNNTVGDKFDVKVRVHQGS